MSVTNHNIENYAGPASRKVHGVTNNDIQNLAGLATQRGQSVTEPTFPSLQGQSVSGVTKHEILKHCTALYLANQIINIKICDWKA